MVVFIQRFRKGYTDLPNPIGREFLHIKDKSCDSAGAETISQNNKMRPFYIFLVKSETKKIPKNNLILYNTVTCIPVTYKTLSRWKGQKGTVFGIGFPSS